MTQTETKSIQEAKALKKEIEALLPSGFKISSISTTAKIPFKAYSWCGAILHRAFELATSSIELYDSGNFITSSIISRALMETVGMLFWMHCRISGVVKEQNLGDIDEYLMRGSLGHKETEGMPAALNALSAIDRVEKQFEGFRNIYDILSEFAHPNWSGTFGTYGKNISEEMRVEYGPYIRELSWAFIPASLCMSLVVLQYSYEELQKILPEFTSLCEKELACEST